jgi:hypothetical protein
MALALDTSTDGGSATTTSHSFSHTCTGPNRILIVAYGTDTADNTDYVTGITYNGVAMTAIDSFRSPGLGGHEMFYLINPASGANNVVITLSQAKLVYAASASYINALDSGQPNTSNGNAVDPNTTLAVSVTTTVPNCWLVSSAVRKAGSVSVLSAGASTTARKVNGGVAIGDSNGPVGAVGSYSQTWNSSVNTGISVITAAITPGPEQGGSFLYNLT